MTDHGKFHWNELMTTDVEGAKAFYAETAGWTFEGMEMDKDAVWDQGGTYWIGMAGGVPAGGIMAMPPGVPEDTAPFWSAYLGVDDVDAAFARAVAAGATPMMEPFDIPGVGRIVSLLDPQGANISIMTPARQE
ncbi:MAG: VOC family protein [Alphaproteobacteria bacterium]|jgi:uncharacterized protein|nr:VOC family protein [Alphaproteobacteria bacterium]